MVSLVPGESKVSPNVHFPDLFGSLRFSASEMLITIPDRSQRAIAGPDSGGAPITRKNPTKQGCSALFPRARWSRWWNGPASSALRLSRRSS